MLCYAALQAGDNTERALWDAYVRIWGKLDVLTMPLGL
jgi:hypothetical protein